MSKEITKAFILQQLEDKFKLRDFEHEKFIFSETVIPTYNIEQHLLKWEIKRETVPATSVAAFLFFTVPDDEQWTMRAYAVIFLGVATVKITGVYVGRPSSAENIYLDMTKNQVISYLVNLPMPVILHPGHTIYIYVDDYTSDMNLRLDVDVQVEKIR